MISDTISSELEFFILLSCTASWLLVIFAYFTANKVDELEDRIKQLELKNIGYGKAN